MIIEVIVKANSKVESVSKNESGAYDIKTTQPAVDGKANKRVIALLAKHLGVAQSRISILRGIRSKRKIIDIS